MFVDKLIHLKNELNYLTKKKNSITRENFLTRRISNFYESINKNKQTEQNGNAESIQQTENSKFSSIIKSIEKIELLQSKINRFASGKHFKEFISYINNDGKIN